MMEIVVISEILGDLFHIYTVDSSWRLDDIFKLCHNSSNNLSCSTPFTSSI
jgi:hypothetical protein